MKKMWLKVAVLPLLLSAALVMVTGCTSSSTVVEQQQVTDVSASEAHILIQQNGNNPDFVILDVRRPDEFVEGHIEGAVNLNSQDENFRSNLDNLDRNDTYLVHCRSGGRSAGAVEIMQELDFTKIYHMTGGMIEWEEEGFPVVK